MNELKTTLNGDLGYLCIYLDWDYGNEIRKEFIEAGKEIGFAKSQIIDFNTQLYLSLISEAPQFSGNVIWVISDGNCYSWKKKGQKAKLLHQFRYPLKSKKINLTKMKKLFISNPNLIILEDVYKINEKKVSKMFPACRVFIFHKSERKKDAALLKARIMSSDAAVRGWDVETQIRYPLNVEINGKLVFTFDQFQILPSSDVVTLPIKSGNTVLMVKLSPF